MNKAVLVELLSHISKAPSAAADRLIDCFGSSFAITEAEIGEITRALDGDEQAALYLKLAIAVASRRFCERLAVGKRCEEKDIEEYLPAYFYGISVETVAVLSLDGAGRIIAIDKANEGTVNFSTVTSRKILEIAKRRKASGVIIAHNHPGGHAIPSDEDVASAKLISEVLMLSGIELRDSYVVAGAKCAKIIINRN